MKKITLFEAFVLFLVLPVFSQSGFIPGFVITHEKDTLYGRVAYVDQAMLREGCQFIREGEATPVTWSPDELYGFGFTGDKFFVSREVTVFTPAHVRRSPAGDRRVPESTIEEKVFLELLVEGAANLYKYSQTVFFAEKNNEFFQLYAEEREVDGEEVSQAGKTFTLELKRYVGVLHIIMNDCPGVGESINAVTLNEEQLVRLFMDYSRCREVEPRFFKEDRSRITLSYTLKGGMQGAGFFFQHSRRYAQVFNSGTFGIQASPSIFALVSISNQKIAENVSLDVGLSWARYNISGFDSYEEGIYDQNHTVEMEYQEIGIPLGVNYSFIRKTVSPYLGVGFLFVLNTGRESLWLWEQVSTVETTIRDTPEDFIKPSQIGLYAAGGLEWPVFRQASLIAELNVHFTNGLLSGSTSNFVISRSGKLAGQLLVGIKF